LSAKVGHDWSGQKNGVKDLVLGIAVQCRSRGESYGDKVHHTLKRELVANPGGGVAWCAGDIKLIAAKVLTVRKIQGAQKKEVWKGTAEKKMAPQQSIYVCMAKTATGYEEWCSCRTWLNYTLKWISQGPRFWGNVPLSSGPPHVHF